MNKKKLFISHSSTDKKIVDAFVDDILIGGFGFNPREIIYTSGEGMGIESGENWRDYLKNGLLIVDVIILIITPNYKSSEICMNEMGASWATNAKVIPMIVEPINFKTVGILAEVKQVEKINSSDGLDNIYDTIKHTFTDINPLIARWTTQKNKFLRSVKILLETHNFTMPISKDSIVKLEEQLNEMKMVNETLLDDMTKLKEYVKRLECKKNTNDIKSARLEAGLLSGINEFENLTDEISRMLKVYDSALTTYIFNSYTGNYLEVDNNCYNREISLAIARGYIDEDFRVLWDKKDLKVLLKSLKKMKKFIDELDVDSYNALEEEYENLDIKNLSFWETVFCAKIIT